MADELIGVMTDVARAKFAQARVLGWGIQVTRFVVGSNGHDPTNPRLALTPDPSRNGCYCSSEAISVADGCLFSNFVTSVTWSTPYCPVYTCTLHANEAVGLVTSICLIGSIVSSLTPGDPVVGTEFLYSITNTPYRVKVPGEVASFAITVPHKL